MKPRVLILHVPGTNRDREAAWACELAGGEPHIAHIGNLAEQSDPLANVQMVLLPGGFSYGDDLGAGRIWATALRERFGDAFRQFVDHGKPVLGICNGFQALLKSGLLLPPGEDGEPMATLTRNESAHFECRWVHLVPDPTSVCLFTQELEHPIECPVAHGEGRFVTRSEADVQWLEQHGLIALRYADSNGTTSQRYPTNPNGSVAAIAGVCNAAGNVLGLMPHPEDHVLAAQHPNVRQRRKTATQRGLGLALFEAAIRIAQS